MDYKDIIKDEHNHIKKELIDKGFANKSINYQEFLELYSSYKEMMNEIEFASILGINYEQHRSLRRRKFKTKILQVSFSGEETKIVRQKLIDEGYANKKINYKEFMELHEKFAKNITEVEFAHIIDISYICLRNMRIKGSKTLMLKRKIDVEKIQEEIMADYGIKLIDYKEFLVIYEKYKKFVNDEYVFAKILGISTNNFNQLKNSGTRAYILKKRSISNNLKNIIINYATQKKFNNLLITYAMFKDLYNDFLNEYPKYQYVVSEKEFANCLNISEVKLRNMKYYDSKTICLKHEYKKISMKRVKEIRNEFILKGYANKTISYDEFLELYHEYMNEMTEEDFAYILKINVPSLLNIKYRYYEKALILKTSEISDNIINEILNDEDIIKYQNGFISKEEFDEIYKKYEIYMTKIQFAEIIGLPCTSYRNISRNSVTLPKYDVIRKRVKYCTSESRLYTKDEIENFCNKYNITVKLFISLAVNIFNNSIINELMDILNNKGVLFIGSCRIEDKVIADYGEHIINMVHDYCYYFGRSKKSTNWCDDAISRALYYIIEKRGDIFINYSEEKGVKKLEYIVKHIIKNYYLHQKNELFIEDITDVLMDKTKIINDKKIDIEGEALENIKNDSISFYEKCLLLIEKYYNSGIDYDEAIDKTAEYLNLTKEELLFSLKENISNKTSETKKGLIYLKK